MLRQGSLLSALAGKGTGGSDGGCFLRTQLTEAERDEKMNMSPPNIPDYYAKSILNIN